MKAKADHQERAEGKAPDFALLLARLEKQVLAESVPADTLRVLARRSVWTALPPEQAVRWARLAQIAGLPDVSLEVLSRLTELHPDCIDAWKARVELLEALGRRPDSRTNHGSPEGPAGGVSGSNESDASVQAEAPLGDAVETALREDPVDEPFALMRRREAAMERFLNLFCGREDCFARQWADRKEGTQGYVPVRRPMTTADVLDHVQGRKTYGIYLLQRDSRVRLGVVDADLASQLRGGKLTAAQREQVRREKDYLLTRLPEMAQERGLPCLTEFSGGKGFHFWFFFQAPLEAAPVREALRNLVKRVAPDLSTFNLEVFPKQDRLAGKGLGNLVKLPLGIHRATGKPSFFLHVADRSPWVQMEALAKVPAIRKEAVQRAAGGSDPAQVVVHPRHAEWAKAFPELAVLSERCAALGQILAGCRQSRTLSVREEKVLLGTVGFLPRARTLLHHVFRELPDYNPHLLDYKLSRLRGTPLGCKRIHSLLDMAGDLCTFSKPSPYPHPLLHWPEWSDEAAGPKSEKVSNLRDAIEVLRDAMETVTRFLPPP